MGFVRRITGKEQANAIKQGAQLNVEAGKEASALLDPFKQIGDMGLAQAGFLTDPQAQYDFLQNNPLFQAALSAGQESLTGIEQAAAARGRLSAGDTLATLQDQGMRNTLLAAQPLIAQQKASIGDLLNFGQSTAINQGNLRTGQAAAQAGGLIGAANARGQGAQNVIDLAGGVLGSSAGKSAIKGIGNFITGLFSDPALKADIKLKGSENGHNIYSWTWNSKAEKLGLTGKSSGVMADEVKITNPEAIGEKFGYMTVDYDAIGVTHD
jgi:hypothetical protein